MIITSLNNEKIKYLTKLNQKKYRSDTFLVEGKHLVEEAYKKNLVKLLIVLEDYKLDNIDNVDTIKVSYDVMKKISLTDTPPKIMAEVIKKEDKKGRTLKIIKGSNGEPYVKSSKDFYVQKELVDVPVIGRITAGQPILAVENVTDTFPIPVDFVGNSESFMLTVRGESMIEAGILDGDYILVKKQNTASNGEIVVALIEDEATVKTFYKEKDHIRLQPENHTMDPIIVPDCRILGKVAGVFRKM